MIVVSVMYGSDVKFDEAYYLDTHMPLVRSRWAGLLADTRVLKGVASGDGGRPAYQIMAEISFPSMAELQQAMGGPHAAEPDSPTRHRCCRSARLKGNPWPQLEFSALL
jgi:uncharacterized protein (TIGR02118 family)